MTRQGDQCRSTCHTNMFKIFACPLHALLSFLMFDFEEFSLQVHMQRVDNVTHRVRVPTLKNFPSAM